MASPLSFEALSAGIAAAPPEDRLGVFYRALQEAPQYVFWPLFLEWLPHFESLGRIRRKLLNLLRAKGSAWSFVSKEDKALYDLQTQEVQVFRGCSPNNRAGLCWCLDYDRSDWYSRLAKVNTGSGNVYEARIPRRAIFAVTGATKGDTTVVLDCDALHDIQLLKFRPTLGTDGHIDQWRTANGEARSVWLRPNKTDYETLFPLDPSLPKLQNLPSKQVRAFRDQHARRLKWEPFRQIVEWLEKAVEAGNEELDWRREHPNHNPKTRRPNWVEEGKGERRAGGSALGHLVAALRAETSKDRLEECAESIEICCALSSIMRTHLASLVRSVAAGELQPQTAIEVVTVARSRIFHQIAVDHLRTIGADGLDSLADAVDGLTDAVGKVKH